jgi:hypothetical protein
MDFIQIEKMNDYNIYFYNQCWQRPVITEDRTFQLFYEKKNIPTNYFAFPWAELLDNHLNNYILNQINNYKINVDVCFTVIQHISFRKILPLIKKIGITHVFVPHKQPSDIKLEKLYNIKILAYPLYPAQRNETNLINDLNNRKYFTSFIGQYDHYYLSKIRENIFQLFSKYNDSLIVRRNGWHYHHMVYGNLKKTNEDFEKEYKQNLQDTIFSLCPSGSGPNSIRIWESMSFGCIPVILADTLVLPEIKDINYNDFFIIWKESEIEKLYDYLKSISNDKLIEMSNKNIEMYNKYFSVDTINQTIIIFFKQN